MPIQNVSDTALWVAVYRAVESERPNALFNDPLARKLAGPEGEQIARELGGRANMSTAMAVRTKLIDDMILKAIRDEGVDVVLNLACGLDARPYRLPLPKDFRWIEADLPGLLDFKESRLGATVPICRLERYRVDLSDAVARRAFLKERLAGSRKALVLTEGLLCYLYPENVEELAQDLRREGVVALWVTDLMSRRLVSAARKTWAKRLERGNAAIHYGAKPAEFAVWGWRARENRSIVQEARQLKRDFVGAPVWRPLIKFLPKRIRQALRQTYSIVLFEAAT